MVRRYLKLAAFLSLTSVALAGAGWAQAAQGTASTAPAADLKNGINVALLDGKVTLQVPADFVNQTRQDSAAANSGVKIQVYADRKRQQVVGISEVPTTRGDANDTSDAAFNKMAQGSLSGLKTQYKDVKKTGQTKVTAGGHKFLRIDTRQDVQGIAMQGSTLVTPYGGGVLTLQVLSPESQNAAHTRLVDRVLSTIAFH